MTPKKRDIKSTISQSPAAPEERPIYELILVLGRDFDRLAKRMLTSAKRGYVSNADATHARNLVRCLFAMVEGATSALKFDALGEHLDRDDLGPPGVAELVFENRYDIGDKGEVVSRPMRITLEQNVKFAFRFFAETYNIPNSLNTNSEWWHAFKRCTAIRDHLMHPRRPEDLDIGPKEIIAAMTAQAGFRKAVVDLLRHRSSRTNPTAV